MCRDQRRLEHHVPQGTATTGDGPFTAKGSAIVRDRGLSYSPMFGQISG